ncbi:MAG TPA: hypothetical protein VN738_11290 [Acidothermaceae bacterium]|nr:hypothetical protein [Acidothermaceae bacterium]
MARISGRKGRVYLGLNSGDAASPIPFVAKWSINFATQKSDVTAMGDSNKVYVAGLPDASGDWSGFFDDASNQSFTVASDGLPRNFYLYADATKGTTGTYFFGTILGDYSIDGDVAGPINMKATWNAASQVSKVN